MSTGITLEGLYSTMPLVLRHPVTLLILTAVLSGIVAPRVSGRWQDRAKAQEIKARLVEDIALAMETYFSRLQLLELKGSATAAPLDDALVDWRTTSAVIEAKLEAFFPKNAELLRQWGEIGAALWTIYFVLRNETPKDRRAIWKENEERLGAPKDFKSLIDAPIWNVGDLLASYDLQLQRLLDRFRYKRLDLLSNLLRSKLSLRERSAWSRWAVRCRFWNRFFNN